MRDLSTRVACVVSFIAIASSSLPVQADSESPCRVVITSPREQALVARRAEVRGIADIPAGAVLWVLAHRGDLTEHWWPQGAATVDGNGGWTVSTEFGRARDTKHAFVVAAVPVNDDTHRGFLDWLANASKRDYPPVPFPRSVAGCAPVTIQVQKAAH